VLWAALVVALTAATYSVTWDLCNAGDDEMAQPTPCEESPIRSGKPAHNP
jgi:hypothetical protein